MVKQGGGGAGGKKEDESVKHMFDRIGGIIQQQVHSASKIYTSELHGDLTKAKFRHGISWEQANKNVCDLIHTHDTNVRWGESYPCAKRSDVRFSDEGGGECDDRKIKDSKNNGGACAPYRRLHLCDYNLEKITDTHTTTTHNLLVDVCLAALHEGQSITGRYPQHQLTYPDSASELCTVLARSFADIGDIIRGKDLYHGKKKRGQIETEREKLEQKLKEIFGKIKGNNNSTLNGLPLDKVREYWWEENRETVWKALTCHAHGTYFHATCGSGRDATRASHQCRCPKTIGGKANDQVPTYFDYVPQYLRWFEEWAEDFCRKRKHKLQNAIKNCRGENGTERYCDLNGFDCTKTARGENKRFSNDECYKCSVACNPFVNWIVNQKQEFLKQKEKYNEEIKKANGTSKGRTTKETSNGPINNLYVKEFYEQLQSGYGDVKKFLELLSKEAICQKPPEVGNEKADNVDFTKDETNGTFYRTKYCRACPLCGVTGENGNWTPKNEPCSQEKKRVFTNENTTKIPKLTPDKSQSGILKKYKNFCGNGKNGEKGEKGDQIENWQCHYEKTDKSNICVLQKEKQDTKEQKVTSYYSFFYGSIIEMLNDSIEWKDKLNICINNKTGNCRRVCKEYCECYRRWIDKKKEEWNPIKDHFRKQEDMVENKLYETDPDMTLKILLNTIFLQDIKDAYPYEQQLEKIEKRLKDKMEDEFNAARQQTSIDEFLQEEEQFAKQCIEKHNKCQETQPQKPQQVHRDVARADTDPDDRSQSPANPTDHKGESEEQEEDDLDEEEEEEEKKAESKEEKDQGDPPAAKEAEVKDEEAEETQKVVEPEAPKVDACGIVKTLFESTNNFEDACTLKYGKTAPTSWKCIPSGEKSGAGATTGGSICVPPRRRKLYVTPLTKWAESKQVTQSQVGGETRGSDVSQGNGVSTSPQAALLHAFVKSAAVETFFLWHKYKAENTKTQSGVGVAPLLSPQQPGSESVEQTPETSLKSGKIPPDFLRLMFYTLGDYRDILYSGSKDDNTKSSTYNDIINADKEMKEKEGNIKTAIEKFFENGDKKPDGVTTPQALWNKHGKDIWNGMICALTYDTNTASGTAPKQINEVKKELLEKLKKKTGEETGTEGEYHYENVKLENSGTQAMSNDTLNNPKLSDFVKLPPFFRWLHEWGSDFCDKRARMLEKIKGECMEDGRRDGELKQKYSGDGEACDRTNTSNEGASADLEGPSCANSCSSYRKWINTKKKEYEKQKSAYGEHQKKCVNGNNKGGGDNGFCGTLTTTYTDAATFLQKLGPCKSNDNEDNNKGDSYIDFNKEDKTFGHAENCGTCPEFKLDCRNGKCIGGTQNECNRKTTITATEIAKMITSTEGVFMTVSDNSDHKFDDGLDACGSANIFKGIRKEQWKCAKVCGLDVCGLKKGDNNGKLDDKQIILISALFKRWVENFVEDYNKINEKLKPCINKNKESTFQNKCNCVEKWITKKKEEWPKIRDRYLKPYVTNGSPIYYNVKSFLEPLQHQTAFKKAIKPCGDLDQFQNSTDCAVDASSEKGIQGTQKDIVECLLKKLDRLKKKIEECQSKHSGKTQNNCVQPPPSDDDDETSTDSDIQKPAFCPAEDIPEKPKEKDICGDDGKTVSCDEVNEKGKIPVPMDPKDNGDAHRNKDGNGTNCAGIPTGESNIKWKNNEDNEYTILSEGIYVSPRRQKLCVKGLQEAQDQNDLRDKLLTTAANDAYNLAIKYNDYKDNYTVPPCHALKYSFYDYKYIILGEDPLESENGNIGSALKRIFEKDKRDDGKRYSDERKQFWETNKYCVWEAMKCGYKEGEKIGKKSGKTSAPDITNCGGTPNEFDNVPQFLMWFTEWSEDFCNQRKKQLEILKGKCEGCGVGKCGIKCDECKKQCKVYEDFINKWKTQYQQQSIKFMTYKETTEYNAHPDVETSKNAYEYLGTQLENITCTSGSNIVYCNCMEETLSTNASSEKMPASLDYPPTEIEGKCDCKPPPKKPEAPALPNPPPQPDLSPLKTALVTSTLAWSVGIGFAAFTYFYLKVLYIYMYMWGYICVFCICIYGYLDVYICGFTCMCFIYILYIYIYIQKEKNEKKKKKKKKKEI